MPNRTCSFYREDAPVCPSPADRGACITCPLFPDAHSRPREPFPSPDQQDDHFMASYCPEAQDE